MSTFNEHDIVYHRTPGGQIFIGIITRKLDFVDLYTVMWRMRSSNGGYESYWYNADAEADKISLVGPMPEGVEWDV